jgi:hypothetical protein
VGENSGEHLPPVVLITPGRDEIMVPFVSSCFGVAEGKILLPVAGMTAWMRTRFSGPNVLDMYVDVANIVSSNGLGSMA